MEHITPAATTPLFTMQNAKRKACDVCKRRKVRCSGENPCQNCLRHGVICEYNMSHGRLAQSERRVATLQRRVRVFENAWKIFVPGIDLATAIHAIENQSAADVEVLASERCRALSNVSDSPANLNHRADDRSSSGSISAPDPHTDFEQEQEDADTLTWDESADIAVVADGIGSLSINSKGIGYMGPQSGNALLRNLQSISMLYFSPYDDLAPQQAPKPTITNEVLQSWSFKNKCIDWYFQCYHCAYPILHEGYFRAQLSGALPKPKDGSWHVLLNTVLAIGAHSGSARDQNADIFFHREVLKYLSWDLLQRGTLSLVQALALLANYLQKRDRPNSGFTLLGVAMNMAQGIGLHRELSGPIISAFSMEVRRRVWWTLFIFDSGARVTFGRPILNLGGITTHLPRNIDDEDLAVDLDDLPLPREWPTVSSSLIWQTKLARIGNIANEKLLETHLPDVTEMLNLGDQVMHWTHSLPRYLQSDFADPNYAMFDVPRMVLLWRSMHLRIVIHRPFLLDHIKKRTPLDLGSGQTPASLCIQAADECVSSILTFWNGTTSQHGSLTWYACYWLVTAVFIHVTCILYEPESSFSLTWRQYITDAKITLESMSPVETTAFRAARMIDKIMSLVPSSPDSQFFITNEPIRMEVAAMWNQPWADMVVPEDALPTQYH